MNGSEVRRQSLCQHRASRKRQGCVRGLRGDALAHGKEASGGQGDSPSSMRTSSVLSRTVGKRHIFKKAEPPGRLYSCRKVALCVFSLAKEMLFSPKPPVHVRCSCEICELVVAEDGKRSVVCDLAAHS